MSLTNTSNKYLIIFTIVFLYFINFVKIMQFAEILKYLSVFILLIFVNYLVNKLEVNELVFSDKLNINLNQIIKLFIPYLFILPIIYKLFNFNSITLFILSSLFLPLLIISDKIINNPNKIIDEHLVNIIKRNAFLIFLFINLLGLIYTTTVFLFIVSVISPLLYIIYYFYKIKNNLIFNLELKNLFDFKKISSSFYKKINTLFSLVKNIYQKNKSLLFIVIIFFLDFLIACINLNNSFLAAYYVYATFILLIIYFSFKLIKKNELFSILNSSILKHIHINLNFILIIFLLFNLFTYTFGYFINFIFLGQYFYFYTSFFFVSILKSFNLITLYLFYISQKIDSKHTNIISELWLILFILLIIIFTLNTIENVIFLSLGMQIILNITLYNLIIKSKFHNNN